MGLFSKTSGNNQDDFDEMDLPTSDDLKGGMFTSEDTSASEQNSTPAVTRTTTTQAKGVYGIEDAINLMRSLPRDNNDVVVTVVKKTLESTNIKVADIIDDADQKESRIRDQHKNLEVEIKDLQEQIAMRNKQITDLLQDLKETTDVRQRLQLALELEGETKKPEKPPEPVAKASNEVKKDAEPAVKTGADTPPTQNADPNISRRQQRQNNPAH